MASSPSTDSQIGCPSAGRTSADPARHEWYTRQRPSVPVSTAATRRDLASRPASTIRTSRQPSQRSSQDDVSIGTVSSGRKRSELEGLLGYFLNPVVLRNDLSGDPTFVELLRRTRNVTLDALSNDDAPFTQVVNEVRPNRSLSVNPLFQVLLTLEPPLPETQPGWTVALTQSEADTGITKFDLCLELDDRPTGIVGRFKYSTDLFEPETIARMAGHLTSLIESIVARPDHRISTFSLLTAQERQQISLQAQPRLTPNPRQMFACTS